MKFTSTEIQQFTFNLISQEPPLLTQVRRYTSLHVVNGQRMQSDVIQGRLLSLLSKIINPKKVIEIGTFTGYATLCLCEGLSTEGTIDTFEVNDEVAHIADNFFRQSEYHPKITLHNTSALKFLHTTNTLFDLAFVDGDKKEYVDYYLALRPKMTSGGVIIIDNILWDGKIFKPLEEKDLQTQTIKKLNEMVAEDNGVEAFPIVLRDGLMVIRVL